MAEVIPVFRIFDYNKVLEFYIDWLGFKIDWEDRPAHSPLYMQVSRNDIVLHLSEHHGDCSPGARVYIGGFEHLEAYHRELLDQNYKFNRPGLEPAPWDENTRVMEVIDPFGNRLTFNSRNS
jgi:catechol 2,3-dioxygenase-like lactoylglutathione lyase family enzyme